MLIILFNIMKNLINILNSFFRNILLIISITIFSIKILASENSYKFEINGNQNTDQEVILSIIEEIPDNISEEYSNYLLNELNQSGLFKDIKIRVEDNIYFINVIEFPVIQKIYFEGNDRLKDEDLYQVSQELNFEIYNDDNIKRFVNELKNIYSSFGYNDVKISLNENISDQNFATVYINIKENKITKIKSIKFKGNEYFENTDLKEVIKSKTKSLTNIFANNNFKPNQVATDKQRLISFYRDNGYADIQINYEVEYFKNNTVILYFIINEGDLYKLENINFSNTIDNQSVEKQLTEYFSENEFSNNIYNKSIADKIEKDISELIKNSGIKFFEINKLVKFNNSKADLLFEVKESKPIYVNNININGNTRTLDYVIRRELEITEGDAFSLNEISNIRKKVKSLGFFEEVDVKKVSVDDNLVDIDIAIKENQTGTFSAGASFGTLDGVTLVTGLDESNIGGTGRSLKFMVNTSENNNEYSLNTTSKFFLNRDVDISYGLSFLEKDYSKSSSYELDRSEFSTGLSYKFQDNIYHAIRLNYQLDNIFITDSSSASKTIKDVEGGSAKFVLQNDVTFNSLNSFLFPKNGSYIKYLNTIETPTSSKNGYIKNTITYKKFKEINKDIASFQAKLGNVFSLNNSDILPNDKFSLGGKWLRGFDSFGVGPRNSRASYIGGNNIFATKIDYSKLLLRNDDNPIYFNVFNDIGILLDNKTTPTFSNESLRSSAGFGLKFYSFIGPIAFTWGFPIEDETYDIKRMFTFSIGNIN